MRSRYLAAQYPFEQNAVSQLTDIKHGRRRPWQEAVLPGMTASNQVDKNAAATDENGVAVAMMALLPKQALNWAACLKLQRLQSAHLSTYLVQGPPSATACAPSTSTV
jgi:hypothetical protein